MNLTCLIRTRQASTVRKNYYNETSMATVASKENVKRAWQGVSQKTMYKFLACEFHPALKN
jgi:predicted DNA-binding protein YlxM (UPF0122 family)